MTFFHFIYISNSFKHPWRGSLQSLYHKTIQKVTPKIMQWKINGIRCYWNNDTASSECHLSKFVRYDYTEEMTGILLRYWPSCWRILYICLLLTRRILDNNWQRAGMCSRARWTPLASAAMSSGISIPKYVTLFLKRNILFWYLPAEDFREGFRENETGNGSVCGT